MVPWHENDEFWAAIEPRLLSDEMLRAAAAEVSAVVRLLGVGAGASILDMGCGPGKTGVDRIARLAVATK